VKVCAATSFATRRRGLFGTFEPERYGLTKDIQSFNPLRIATHELFDMGREARAARSGSERARLVFGRPRDAA
jgi:hypothetical protein